MPAAPAMLMLALGCAPAPFNGPGRPFVVLVCPSLQAATPGTPEGREG